MTRMNPSKIGTWSLALVAVAVASTPAAAQPDLGHYSMFERTIAVTGDSQTEATVRLTEKVQSVTVPVSKEVRSAYGRVLLSQIANVRRLDGPLHPIDGPIHRLECSVRFVIWTPKGLTTLLRSAPTPLDAYAPLILTLRASDSPSSRDVRFVALELYDSVIRRQNPWNAMGVLLRDAWRDLRGDRPDRADVTSQGTVRVPYGDTHWEFALDAEILEGFLRRVAASPSRRPVTSDELQALKNAYDLMQDPTTDPNLRLEVARLRYASQPVRRGSLGESLMRALSDPKPVTHTSPSRSGLLGAIGD